MGKIKKFFKPILIFTLAAIFALFSNNPPIFKFAPILTYIVLMIASGYFLSSILEVDSSQSNLKKEDES